MKAKRTSKYLDTHQPMTREQFVEWLRQAKPAFAFLGELLQEVESDDKQLNPVTQVTVCVEELLWSLMQDNLPVWITESRGN